MDQIKRVDNILYGPKVDIPKNLKGLGRTIFDKLEEHKNKTLMIDTDTNEERTYGEVNKQCVRVALHLLDRGTTSGDIILNCSQNNLDTVLPIYGTMYLNAVTVTLDPSISLRDSITLVKTVSPKFIFVVEDAVELIDNVLTHLDIKPNVVVMGRHKTHETISEFLKPHPDEDSFVPANPANINDMAVIFFSSGTTGLPKGICHSHSNMLEACDSMFYDAIDCSVALYYTSFYWISAHLFSTMVLLAGGKRLISANYTPEKYLKILQKYEVTYSFLPTTYALQINDENIKSYKKRTLKEMRVGGSLLTAEHMKRLCKYFPNAGIYTGYGQTELCGGGSMFNKYCHAVSRTKYGSCGMPYINVQIKISDTETGKTLGPNEKGEIRVKTPTAFLGYFNKNSDDSFDEEGYIKTGDVGYYDEENCLYFSDRLKEMFKYQSWHIVPASLESVIYDHPAVLETIVIGVPHELDDHHPLGLVTLKDSGIATEEDILQFVNDKLIEREKLRAGLKIVKNFPRTATGKIARQIARKLVLEGNISELYK